MQQLFSSGASACSLWHCSLRLEKSFCKFLVQIGRDNQEHACGGKGKNAIDRLQDGHVDQKQFTDSDAKDDEPDDPPVLTLSRQADTNEDECLQAPQRGDKSKTHEWRKDSAGRNPRVDLDEKQGCKDHMPRGFKEEKESSPTLEHRGPVVNRSHPVRAHPERHCDEDAGKPLKVQE